MIQLMAHRSRQLPLDLRLTPRWGGRREGAGRRPGSIRRDPHRRRAPLHRAHPCHVTLKIRRGLPSLRSRRLVIEFEHSLREACERGRFRVVHYSIQRDHVHAIVEATSARDLASGMKSLGARLARAVHRALRLHGPILADRFHLHVLRTPREVRNAIAYVLLNARRHAAKLGRRIDPLGRIDPASSGRWFRGWRNAPGRSRDAPAVAAPRSWLLAIGWRRAGLLHPSEIPGSRR
jgi:REP element-mobilizing transposase RayT